MNEKENDCSKQLVRKRPSRVTKSRAKKKQEQKISNMNHDSSGDDQLRQPINQKTSQAKKQKYFIVVEETSSRGVKENLLFLVEENPSHTYPETKRNVKKPPKRSKLELSTRSVESTVSSNSNIATDANDVNNQKNVGGSKFDCDSERLQLQVKILDRFIWFEKNILSIDVITFVNYCPNSITHFVLIRNQPFLKDLN